MLKFLRKINFLNKIENGHLTEEFDDIVQDIKERNSQTVFDFYYMPKAVAAVLKEENYLAVDDYVIDRARAMLLYDKAQGVLDEFYRFAEKK